MTTVYSLYGFLYENDNEFNVGPVYHGGSWDGTKPIRTSGKGALGVGAYFSPIKTTAERYAKESGGTVTKVMLSIKNPLKIESGDGSHPMVQALVKLGVNNEKAIDLVERIEEEHGYMGSQVKNLALKQGYNGIFQYFNGVLTEIVVWNAGQVQPIKDNHQ